MNLYERYILPPLISAACSTKPIMKQREKILHKAKGVVLEMGCGNGVNFDYYDSAKVKKLLALEPAEGMVKRASKRAEQTDLDIEIIQDYAENLPVEAKTVDTLVFTFTLCTIPDWRSALEAARKTLKPNGVLLFSEHGGSPDPEIAKWQRRWEPVQKTLGGGCHVTRIPTDMLAQAGYKVEDCQNMYLPSTPKVLGYQYWGHARPA